MHWWENYPWRMIQTNLREIDMEDMDAKKYVADLQAFGATVVTLNAAGIIASYDTELEDQPRCRYLHGDTLQTVVEECHKAGIKVIARMDFSKILYEVYEKHPNWAYRRADGQIVNYNGYVHTCPNSDYQQNYSLEIVKEVLHKIPFDGVFCNMSGFLVVDYDYVFHGPCHCENCKRLFKELYGAEIPMKEDPRDPAYKMYAMFKAESTRKQKMNLHRTIRDVSPEIAINGVDYVRIESNSDVGIEKWAYSASSNARIISGPKRDRVVDSAAVDFHGFRYRDTSVSPAQMELRQWQNLANSGSCSIYIMGRLDTHKDISSFAGTKKVFRFHKEHEALYRGIESTAEVMLIHRNMMGRFDHETFGWIRALTESHIPFDEIRHSELKSVEQLSGKKIAILCDAKQLNAQQAELLDAFVENGGIMLVTGDTGLQAAMQKPQEPFVLKCMGVERIVEKKTKLRSSTLFVDGTDKELFPHCVDAPYIAIGEEFVMADFKEGTQRYLNLIGEHPYGPPEICYYTEADMTGHPGVTVYPYGKGKGVYLPWMAGAFYYTEGLQNTLNIMQDVLCSLCGASQIAPELSPMVEVNVGKKENMTIIQLVNTSGVFSNSFFPPIPIYDIELHIPVEARESLLEPKSMEGDDTMLNLPCVHAYNGGTVSVKKAGKEWILTLDKLSAYEIITMEGGVKDV